MAEPDITIAARPGRHAVDADAAKPQAPMQTEAQAKAAAKAQAKAALEATLPSTTDGLPAPAPKPTVPVTPVIPDSAEPKPRSRWWLWALFTVIILTAAVTAGLWLGSRSGEEEPQPTGYVSPYDWERITIDDKERLHYTDAEGNPASLVGIDCSEWDTGTDWAAVAADGIEFALIRVGYRGSSLGGLYKDKLFEEAYAGATGNGILVGLYFFSQATNAREGREEAEFILDILGGRHLDLPICFDHEGIADPESRAYGLTHEAYSAAARAFCNRLEHAGYTVAIYGNRYAIAYLGEDEMADYSIWLAEWDTDRAHAMFDFSIWQFTNAGHVEGMWRRVDHSIWFTNEVPFKTRESRAAALEATRGDLPYDLVLVPVDRSL